MTPAARLQWLHDQEYLTLAECAELARMSKASVRRRLPKLADAVLRHGRIVRVPRIAWMRQHAVDRDVAGEPGAATEVAQLEADFAAWFAARPDLHWAHFPDSGVYFVQAGPLIKIGLAKRMDRRLAALRHASPIALIDLGWIACEPEKARQLEKSLHAQFRDFRVYGEWFHATPVLERFIVSAITACSWPRR